VNRIVRKIQDRWLPTHVEYQTQIKLMESVRAKQSQHVMHKSTEPVKITGCTLPVLTSLMLHEQLWDIM
jgi:hypothetical protein